MTSNRRFALSALPALVVLGAVAAFQSVPAQVVTLTRDGNPEATIVVPDPASPAADGRELPAATARTAAEELQKYIARASGAELPIVAASQAPSEGTLVLVGRSALTDKFGLFTPTESEGVRIKTFPRGLALLGEIAPRGTNNSPYPEDRGTLNATYIFLEKHLGYRFYFQRGPDAELGRVSPHRPTITVGPIDYESAPFFPYRQIVPYSGTGDWKAATRPGKATGFSCNHTHMGWNSLYQESHPEYFSLLADGSRDFRFLCYGNPEVLERELEHIDTYYRTGQQTGGKPGPKYIPVEPDDNWVECRDDFCRALIEPDRGRFAKHSRLWWDHYIRELGLAVKQRWPDKRVAALAYQGRIWPGNLDLPDNVDVQVCVHNAPLNFYKEPAARREIGELLGAWSKKLGGDRSRLYIWDYTCYPQYWSCAPTLYPNTLQQFLRENRDRIGGVFLNGGEEIIQADHYMVAVTFALLWDPDLDVDAHLRDYCRNFFGPGADAMERLYRLLFQRYEQVHWPKWTSSGYSAYVPPTWFYGLTYTPEVVEEAEQLLCEAQAAVGDLPGGRAAEFVGEGWFIRRNAADTARPFEVVMEAGDQPVRFPTVRWADGRLLYRDTLVRGQKLVVQPGPRARLLPAMPTLPREVIPSDRRLAGGLKAFSQKYVVHTARSLRIPAFPGAEFRVTITGKAADGANSFLAVQWSTGKWTYLLQNRFDGEPRTVSQVITAPPGTRFLYHVYVYRGNQKGTVWYGDLSVRREFPPTATNLPPEGKDVTALIDGDAPVVPAHTSYLFHLFSDTAGPGVVRDALDLHVGADDDTGETTPDSGDGTEGGKLLSVSVEPQGAASGDAPRVEPTLYQRRVAWMRDGWENFHPQESMYRSHDGFLVAARVAHKWVNRTPEYRVPRVELPPKPDLADPAWTKAPATTLVRGRSKASVPVDNLGFDPGTGPTEIRILQDETAIYAAFHCIQPEAPNEEDSVTLKLYNSNDIRNAPPIAVTCRPGKTPETDAAGITSETVSGAGWWAVFVTIPRSSAPGLGAEHRADLLRTRKGRAYVWSPPINAPWTDMPMARRGRIVFGKTNGLVETNKVTDLNGKGASR
jgi:hypothetical protein